MDIDTTTEDTNSTEASVAAQIAIAFAVSAAATVGTFAAMFAIGAVATSIERRRTKKANKTEN